MIELKNLSKYFGEKKAVDGVSLRAEGGKISMLIGPSGCGKTSILKMVNRLLEANGGDILVKGRSIYDMDPVELRRGMGYVIQETGLFPHMNVYDNIAVVPRLLKWDERRISRRVDELLSLVTLDPSYREKYPLQLSGGEGQRVGLARALAADPEVLLMDEPFGAIDPINRGRLHELFLDIQRQLEKTILFVTHDINEAIKLGDMLAVLNAGRLIQYDTVPNILHHPADPFVEQLLGRDRNIKALVLNKTSDYIRKEGPPILRPDSSEPEIRKALESTVYNRVVQLTSEGRLLGTYAFVRDEPGGEKKILFRDDPVTVHRETNLQTTFSLMIEAGESSLVVVDEARRFIGVVHLEDIFNSFKKTASEDPDGVLTSP